MEFKLYFLKDKIKGGFDKDDTYIQEALYEVYSTGYNYEVLLMFPDDIISCFGFIDLDSMYNDVIEMVDNLKDKKQSFTIQFGSNSFLPRWHFKIDKSKLHITIDWMCCLLFDKGFKVNLRGENLEKYGEMKYTFELQQFLNEWLRLLSAVYDDLVNAGYDNTTLEDFDHLEKICKI